MAVVRPPGQGGRRHDGEHARYRGQPTRVPAEPLAEARPRLPDRPDGRPLLPGHRRCAGGGRGRVPGEADRRERPVSKALGRGPPCRDVSLGDRYYGSYFDIALLIRRGVDGVYRLHQLRVADFRRGRRLGKEDHVVTWSSRPAPSGWARRPMSRCRGRWRCGWCGSTWTGGVPHAGAGPGDHAVRCRRLHEEGSGFVIPSAVGGGAESEVDQGGAGAGRAAVQAPELVRKEIWMGLLAYNVIRAAMAEAAGVHGRMPHRLSFKGGFRRCWRTRRDCARGPRGSVAGCGGSCWSRSPTTRWGTARTEWNHGHESDGPSPIPY